MAPEPSSPPALEVQEAKKSYPSQAGPVQALDGLSFVMEDREWLGLLGPNGAGKSTLMAVVAGLLPLDFGVVRLFGERPGADPAARWVGYVPQEIALYPLLTTRQNLEAFARLHGVPRAELPQRVAWALDWTGLSARAGDLARDLSGGMQRRLNIACGVLHGPRLILLDEPTVGVDPQGRQRIWEMLGSLRAEGASLVHSTHELHEIESVCDRVAILDHGRILASGPVSSLVEETLGGGAVLDLLLEGADGGAVDPGAAAAALGSGSLVLSGTRVRGPVADVARELPILLNELRAARLGVASLHIDRPGLEKVFTHLTGRELRE